MEEKIVLKNCWDNKYIDHEKDYVKKSLNGNITFYHDKWGAFLISRNTFGNGDRLYSCELEYIQAIKHLISNDEYIKLLANRNKINEGIFVKDFKEKDALLNKTENESKWVKIAKQIIKDEDFELYINDRGFYALKDLQGADLGDIEYREYTSLAQIIDDLGTYHVDYYLEDMEECLEKDFNTLEDAYEYANENKIEMQKYYSDVNGFLDELYVILYCYDIPELNEKIREEE